MLAELEKARGIPKGKEKGVKNVFDEIMAEKFSHLRKETDIQIQKAQRIPNKINLKEAHAKT